MPLEMIFFFLHWFEADYKLYIYPQLISAEQLKDTFVKQDNFPQSGYPKKKKFKNHFIIDKRPQKFKPASPKFQEDMLWKPQGTETIN